MSLNEIIWIAVGLFALFATVKLAWSIFKFIIGIKIIMWTIKFVVVCFALVIPLALIILTKGTV